MGERLKESGGEDLLLGGPMAFGEELTGGLRAASQYANKSEHIKAVQKEIAKRMDEVKYLLGPEYRPVAESEARKFALGTNRAQIGGLDIAGLTEQFVKNAQTHAREKLIPYIQKLEDKLKTLYGAAGVAGAAAATEVEANPKGDDMNTMPAPSKTSAPTPAPTVGGQDPLATAKAMILKRAQEQGIQMTPEQLDAAAAEMLKMMQSQGASPGGALEAK